MPKRSFRLHDGRVGSALAVRVTPRASRNEVVEVMTDGTVRIRIMASPVDGEANEKLVSYLAEVLNVPKSRLEIVAGLSGRDKLISVLDMDAATVHKRIVAHLG
jgi:uncharacterized protein (TIGR00251 family)